MKNLSFVLLVLLILNACASLTRTQVDSVKKFADATIDYADYPGILVNDYLDLQNNIFLIRSPLITNPEKAVSSIYNNQQMLAKNKKDAEKMNLCFNILKCYAENLELLATTDYNKDINASALNLKTNMDTLIGRYNKSYNKNIPKIGNLVFKAFLYFGERYVENERANAIKKYLEKGNEIVCEMSSVTKDFVDNNVKNGWMLDITDQVKANHMALRKQIIKDTLNYSVNIISIREIDKEILTYYDEIDYLNELTESLIISLDKICMAHQALSKNIKEKKKLDDLIPEVKDFYYSVEDLRDIRHSYKSN
jgi:hypothetical protein